MKFKKLSEFLWELERTGRMRVPGILYASERMIAKIEQEKVADQIANVATLPGIVRSSLAMPDVHWGYGAPIGGVAAFDLGEGVISPGMVGYDISCGVRLLRSNLNASELSRRVPEMVRRLFHSVPSGVGSEGSINLSKSEMHKVFMKGSRWAVERGYGDLCDLDTVEDGGYIEGADPEAVSSRALERGRSQMGTLGSGNHFLEIQVVDEIYDAERARVFGLFMGQMTVLIHTGSRGCGYQVCDDYIRTMQEASRKYGIDLADRQLCCAPLSSPEGRRYYAAMCAATNYARANRQAITNLVRDGLMKALGMSPGELGLQVVYDVSHNIARMEEHEVKGKKVKLCVHRKGATRAFPEGHPEVCEAYRNVGQPVLVPGSMGSFSYLLVGTDVAVNETFATSCHGAGRVMSRSQALKLIRGQELARELKEKGIFVETGSYKGLAEEAPFAYKDVSEVVDVCHGAGISRKVARMKPLGVVKG